MEKDASQAEIFEDPLTVKRVTRLGMKGRVFYRQCNQQTLETASFLIKVQKECSLSGAVKAGAAIFHICTPYANQTAGPSAGGQKSRER